MLLADTVGQETKISGSIEIYFHQYHNVDDEDAFIRYLLRYGATHKEINESLDVSLRKIQTLSKEEKGEM